MYTKLIYTEIPEKGEIYILVPKNGTSCVYDNVPTPLSTLFPDVEDLENYSLIEIEIKKENETDRARVNYNNI